jgi:hypothetical protein
MVIGCEPAPSPVDETPTDPAEDDITGTWEGTYEQDIWTFEFGQDHAMTLLMSVYETGEYELSGTWHIDSTAKLLIVNLLEVVSGGEPPLTMPLAIAFSYELSAEGDHLVLYILNLGGTIDCTKML